MIKVPFCSFTILVATSAIALLSCNARTKNEEKQFAKKDALDNLMAGNYRFSHWQPGHPDESRERVAEIAKGQHPVAVVISCSDSRVPPELVFDQGLGDLFVVRTAGNLVGGLEIGSVEYAVEHLHVPLIIVLGHQQCGAVKAFVEGGEVPGHIRDIIDSLKAEEEIRHVASDDKMRLDHCIRANVQHAAAQLLRQSSIIREKAGRNEVKIVSAIYDIEKGTVNRIDR